MAIVDRESISVKDRFSARHSDTVYTIEITKLDEDGKIAALKVVAPKDFKGPKFGSEEKRDARLTGGKDGRTFPSLAAVTTAIHFPSMPPSAYVFFTPEADFGKEKVKAEKPAKTATAKKAKAKTKAPVADEDSGEMEIPAATKVTSKSKAKNPSRAAKAAAAAPKKGKTKKAGKSPAAKFEVVQQLTDGRMFCAACLEHYTPDQIVDNTCPVGHNTENFGPILASVAFDGD